MAISICFSSPPTLAELVAGWHATLGKAALSTGEISARVCFPKFFGHSAAGELRRMLLENAGDRRGNVDVRRLGLLLSRRRRG
jgi:hypothetical protein